MDKRDEKVNLKNGQIEIEASKYEPFGDEHITRAINLPSSYGKDRIIAMVRDPWWIHAYWEITPQREKAIRDEIERSGKHFEKTILRIYDITGVKDFDGKNANSFFDITLENLARNWYVDIGAPGKRLCIDIGIMTKEGVFFLLARSNIITTPRFGMSDILDAAWMLSEEDYWWLFGVSGGFGVGKSSMEMREMFQKQLREWVSSGGMLFSLSSNMLVQKR